MAEQPDIMGILWQEGGPEPVSFTFGCALHVETTTFLVL
jgi:hypothetical protein